MYRLVVFIYENEVYLHFDSSFMEVLLCLAQWSLCLIKAVCTKVLSPFETFLKKKKIFLKTAEKFLPSRHREVGRNATSICNFKGKFDKNYVWILTLKWWHFQETAVLSSLLLSNPVQNELNTGDRRNWILSIEIDSILCSFCINLKDDAEC